jgi:pectinesterase
MHLSVSEKMTSRCRISGLFLIVSLVGWMSMFAREKVNIVVSPTGDGNFRTIQEAINSIPTDNSTTVTILVRNGVYGEKVFLQKSHVTIVGEDRDSTRIIFAELRENWNKDHQGSDWGSGVVNIDTGVTDITLANLTVYNNYGWQNGVFNKHQFAIRGAGTRIMLLHCKVVSDGGDALSLWNRQDGMYYHSDCEFEGWVDFVCPRGWCHITNSQFFGHNRPSASIWHDGTGDKDQKFVIRNSHFDGVPGFPLGRNHLDAQFYLVNCTFSRNMADRPFFRPPSSPREWQWGARHYFFNCHRDGGDFKWFGDNLEKAEGSPNGSNITAKWTFGGRWDPEASLPSVLPFAFFPHPERNVQDVNTNGVNLSWVAGRNADSHNVYFGKSNPPEYKGNRAETSFDAGRLEPRTTYYWRVDEVTEEGAIKGKLWSFKTR